MAGTPVCAFSPRDKAFCRPASHEVLRVLECSDKGGNRDLSPLARLGHVPKRLDGHDADEDILVVECLGERRDRRR